VSDENKLADMAQEPIIVYQTFVKPVYNQHLSEYIQSLTGITQDKVDHGQKFQKVMSDIHGMIMKNNVKNILIWGPDKTLLRRNCDVLDCYNTHAKSICNRLRDVSKQLSDFFGYDATLSQHKVCQMLRIEEAGELHDAYCDALNLSRIIRAFYGQLSL
jgi:inhibitor of KinA sporulation pathway (predicted exonuclease)